MRKYSEPFWVLLCNTVNILPPKWRIFNKLLFCFRPQKYQRDYHIDTSDVGYSWKHYRLSNQTLTARNARAKSPIQSRELDRYYKTERRTSFIGDVSSGSNRDFRYYSYRPVPYFGGSDHYQYVDRILKCVRKTIDYPMWYDIK